VDLNRIDNTRFGDVRMTRYRDGRDQFGDDFDIVVLKRGDWRNGFGKPTIIDSSGKDEVVKLSFSKMYKRDFGKWSTMI
jgi:hypothetical protein